MGLEKSIASGKEHRKTYRGSKSFNGRCRNNKSCSYCRSNRQYRFLKSMQKSDYDIEIIFP